MAGGQEIGAKLLGFFPKQAEFNKFIAGNAGIGRLAPAIGIDEIVDDIAAE